MASLNMGLGLAGAAAGAGGALERILARRLEEELSRRKLDIEQQRNDQQGEYQKVMAEAQAENIRSMAAQREAMAAAAAQNAQSMEDQRQAGVVKTMTGMMRPGQEISQQTSIQLPDYLQRHEPGSMASTQMQGAVTMPGGPTPQQGFVRTSNQPAMPPRTTYTGTFDQLTPKAGQEDPEAKRLAGLQDYEDRQKISAKYRPPRAPTVTFTPEGLAYSANYLNRTGNILPTGLAAGARVATINEAAKNPDSSLALNKATFTADQASLTNVQKLQDMVGAFEQTASKNSDVMMSAAKKLSDSGSPWLNRPWREAERQGAGDPNVAEFAAARRVVANEYARIVTTLNLNGVLSDQAREEMDRVLNGEATIPQMISTLSVLRRDAANRLAAYRDKLAEIKGRIGGETRPSAPGTTQGGTNQIRYDMNGNPIPR